jgi:alkylation response protein AidB-like acyl-CoA dehydrogenase
VDQADAVLVVTRTGVDEASGRGRLSLFIVDADAPGLQRRHIPLEVTGPHRQFLLFFDDVAVPAERLLGTEGDGLRQVFHGLNPERIIGAAAANGIARYALGRAAAYANQRRVWDAPIGAHQRLAHPLAAAKIDVELARLMTQKAAWATDHASGAPARRPTWPSTRRPRPPCRRSTPPSRSTAATASPPSTASPACGGWPGSCGPPR